MKQNNKVFQFDYEAYRQLSAYMAEAAVTLSRCPESEAWKDMELCLNSIACVLSQAQVIRLKPEIRFDPNAPTMKMLSAPRGTIETDDQAGSLYGCDSSNILYYNYDTEKWNKDEFLGHKLPYSRYDAVLAMNFKYHLESDHRYSTRYELASIAVRIVPTFPGVGKVVENPAPGNGTTILGALISRCKETGVLVPTHNRWIGVKSCASSSEAAIYAISSLCVRAERDKFFMQAIKEAYVKNYM